MLLLIWTDLQSGNLLCFLKWYVRIFYPSFGHVENLALFFIYIALTMFLKSLEDFVTGLFFFFFFMAVTSHKNYLFIPSGFPLPPVWFGSNSRFFFFWFIWKEETTLGKKSTVSRSSTLSSKTQIQDSQMINVRNSHFSCRCDYKREYVEEVIFKKLLEMYFHNKEQEQQKTIFCLVLKE